MADSDLYAKHFQAQRIIHELDSHSSKEAEMVLSSDEDRVIDQGKLFLLQDIPKVIKSYCGMISIFSQATILLGSIVSIALVRFATLAGTLGKSKLSQ